MGYNRPFVLCVRKVQRLLTDKQDPSLVTELCYTYQLFYDHECDATGLWLELIYLTFSAFYDKALSPEERMVNVSIVRATHLTWREACVKRKAVTKHFITTPTYEEMITDVITYYVYDIKHHQISQKAHCSLVFQF